MNKNRYEIKDNYVIGYTPRGLEFYFDFEDYDLVTQFYWIRKSNGVVVHKEKGKSEVSMHKLLMGEDAYVHKNGKKYDNRKENLANVRGYNNNGRIILNGYIAIYSPKHPRAFVGNGCVYEHILVAEKKLGRPLDLEECVHHIDFNRKNNNEDNLMVFKTNKDHALFHYGAKAIVLPEGSYVCEKNIEIIETNKKINDQKCEKYNKHTYKYEVCPICKTNIKTIKSNMCDSCRKKEKSKHIPSKYTLEETLKDKKSFVEVGRFFGVTDNSIRKWCKKYGLPHKKKALLEWIKKEGE